MTNPNKKMNPFFEDRKCVVREGLTKAEYVAVVESITQSLK